MPKQPLLLTIKYKYLILSVFIALTIFFAFGLPKLILNTKSSQVINKNSRIYRKLQNSRQTYGHSPSVTLFAKTPNIYNVDFLHTYRKLIQELQQNKQILSIKSIFNIPYITQHDDLTLVSTLIPKEPISVKNLPLIKERALANREAMSWFIADNNKLTIAKIQIPSKHNPAAIDTQLTHIVNKYNTSQYTFGFTGGLFFHSTIEKILKQEATTVLISALIAIILMTFILFRKLLALLLPIITSSISIIWTLGLIGYFHIPLNYLSSSIPAMLVIIGSTEDIYLLSSYYKGRKLYTKKIFAIKYMLKNISYAVILTSLTTTIGFLSFAFTPSPIYQQWGLTVAIGMFFNGIITLILAPIIIYLIDNKKKITKDKYIVFNQLANSIYQFIEKKRSVIFIVFSIICIVCIYGISKLSFDINGASSIRSSHPLQKKTNMIKRNFHAFDEVTFNIHSPNNQLWSSKENLKKLLKFSTIINKKPQYNFIQSLATYIASINENIHQDKEYYRIPNNQNTIEQYINLTNSNDIKNLLSSDKKQTRIIAMTTILSSQDLIKSNKKIHKEFYTVFPSDYKLDFTGGFPTILYASHQLIKEILLGYLLLLCLTFLLFYYNFRSWQAGLISTIINGLPALVLLATVAFFKINLDVGITAVLTIGLSISIDNTVHIMTKYSQLTYASRSPKIGLAKTIDEDFQPICTSTIAAICGFIIVSFSQMTWVRQIGIFTSITLFTGLIADIILLPAFLYNIRIINILDCIKKKYDLNILKKSPIFKGFSNSEIRTASCYCELRKFSKNEDIIKRNEKTNEMYLLLKGNIVQKNHQFDPGELLKVGSIIGETSFFTGNENIYSVKTKSNTHTLVFHSTNFDKEFRFAKKINTKIRDNIIAMAITKLQNLIKLLEKRNGYET